MYKKILLILVSFLIISIFKVNAYEFDNGNYIIGSSGPRVVLYDKNYNELSSCDYSAGGYDNMSFISSYVLNGSKGIYIINFYGLTAYRDNYCYGSASRCRNIDCNFFIDKTTGAVTKITSGASYAILGIEGPVIDIVDNILYSNGSPVYDILNNNIYGLTSIYKGPTSNIYYLLFYNQYYENNYNEILGTPPSPTTLQQWVKSPSPELDREPITPGEKIGKYQSGSGIILTAYTDNNTGNPLNMEFQVYRYGSTTPIETLSGTMVTTNTGQVTLSYYGTGSYYWKVRTIDNSGNASDWVSFTDGISLTGDFGLYEGFEPYPFGYNFVNRHASGSIITGGILYNWKAYLDLSGFNKPRIKIDGTKWDVFESSFNTLTLNDENKLFDAFESVGLNKNNALQDSVCNGMATSAAMQYAHSDYLYKNFLEFYNNVGTNGIWNTIESPNKEGSKKFDIFNYTLKTLLAFQLSYKSTVQQNAEKNGISNPGEILTELKNHPNNTYVLSFWGTSKDNIYVGHSVIPYKVEGNNIYIWDNNVPYEGTKVLNKVEFAYNQRIEINLGGTGFTAPMYTRWKSFDKISLVNIDNIYNLGNKSTPVGFNGSDYLYTLEGSSDLIVTDGQGRISGFSGGIILEEIPGVKVIPPLYDIPDGEPAENTWKQIYLPEKQDLIAKVIAKGEENYNLMIAGGDYYTKLSNIQTSTGQIDTFESKIGDLKIDFDDTKTGSYNLFTDNFQENNTGTIYIDSVPVIISKQEYDINWTKVRENSNDAVIQKVDINNDGIYDTTIQLPPIFQDLLSPTTAATFSGTFMPNATASYIETTTITFQAIDNEGGTGIDKIYFSLDNTGTTDKVYTQYTTPIIVNGVNQYTLSYYSIDKFGNKETVKTVNFSLTEKVEVNNGEISGYVYEDLNSNGIKDTTEKTMAGWKMCIDKNNNGTCEENTEPFQVTNNQGYYEFNGLATGTYKILETPHQNWAVTNPTTKYYTITLSNGQKVTNKNYGNLKTKGK